MNSLYSNLSRNSLSRALRLREAAIMVFRDPVPVEYTRLMHLARKDWEDLLRWLDTSGLALYFFDRLRELNLLQVLPSPVLARLRQNLADNSERIDEMITESVAIQHRFQEAGISYAVLKGFSLWPISVPKLELRSQLDLDFLVAEESADSARKTLEGFGYRLNAISGQSWEFKASGDEPSSLESLYKKGQSRSAELHVELANRFRPSLLSRTHNVGFRDVLMPVLSPVDLFLGQGQHLYKHVCSEFSRTAHIIEFRQHVITRYGDRSFWRSVQQQASSDLQTRMQIGVVILLITRVMGPFAPEALTRWTVDQLPSPVCRWVDRYGLRTALMSFPGSKLYLLLQKELSAAGMPSKRTLRQALLPRSLPPAITHAVAGEGLLARLLRYREEVRFIFFRLRFHLLEGVRYFCESILWQRYRNGASQ
jgi:hypothetical protein